MQEQAHKGGQLTFTLCPGKGLPLPPQQAAESVTQTTQQMLGQALVEGSFWVRPSSILRAGRGALLLQLLLFQRQPGEEMREKGLRGEPMWESERGVSLEVIDRSNTHLCDFWEWLVRTPASPVAWAQLRH